MVNGSSAAREPHGTAGCWGFHHSEGLSMQTVTTIGLDVRMQTISLKLHLIKFKLDLPRIFRIL